MDKKYIVSFIIFLFFFFKHVYSEKIDQIEIFADKFTHDKNNKRIYAVGNVEVIDDNFKILSNEIIYNND